MEDFGHLDIWIYGVAERWLGRLRASKFIINIYFYNINIKFKIIVTLGPIHRSP